MFDELQDFATVGSLPAVAEGRAVYTDEILAGAIYFDTPLSHTYVLDELTPLLEPPRQAPPREPSRPDPPPVTSHQETDP